MVQQRLAKKLKLKSTDSVAGPEDGLDRLFKGEPRPLLSSMMQTLREWGQPSNTDVRHLAVEMEAGQTGAKHEAKS